jgi:L,D-peptidoglycan transpeptidase YkuD (ErfK/YbiS/YcfS/YnhG family)
MNLIILFASLVGIASSMVLPLDKSAQVLVVHGQLKSPKAELILFTKASGKWVRGKRFEAVIGKNGMGFGKGIEAQNIFSLETKKQEGDGKSPSGVFTLGRVFGKAERLPFFSNYPYVQILPSMEGVDDRESKYYNQIVNTSEVQREWKSFESIFREDHLYDWFVEINHNSTNTPGEGSLIFLHVWRKEGEGTAGCTALEEKDLLYILKWLDKDKNPLFILLPSEKLGLLKKSLPL